VRSAVGTSGCRKETKTTSKYNHETKETQNVGKYSSLKISEYSLNKNNGYNRKKQKARKFDQYR